MTNELTPLDQARALAPARMRERFAQGTAVNKNFADGVRDTFPTLSIKGRVFRMRSQGQEQPYVNPETGQAYTALDVVFVNASRLLAKSFYIKGYSPGDLNPPDCWSLDSIRPDPSVAEKQSAICASCAQNAFGSRITDNGKQAKACQDQRRVAITLPHLLMQDVPQTMLMRVPQSSLKNLKAYTDLLARHQFEPTGCITRLSFEIDPSHPVLQFQFVRALTDDDYDKVDGLGSSDYVMQMLNVPEEPVQKLPIVENEPLKELVPQAAPIMAEQKPPEEFSPVPAPTIAPAVQQAVAAQNAEHLIALPDGKFFNPTTGQYVEAPKPKEEIDPAIVALPDGKFFNPATGQYVPTNLKGGAAPAPVKEEPKKAPAKKAAPKKEETKSAPQGDLLPPTGDAPPAQKLDTPPKEAAKPVQKAAAAPTGNGVVGVAPPDLDDILKGLVPPSGA